MNGKTREAVVQKIKPNFKSKDEWGYERNYVGHVAVLDETGQLHYFNNGTLTTPLRKFPDLNEGDIVRIKYERGPNYGLWFVTEVLLDKQDVHA